MTGIRLKLAPLHYIPVIYLFAFCCPEVNAQSHIEISSSVQTQIMTIPVVDSLKEVLSKNELPVSEQLKLYKAIAYEYIDNGQFEQSNYYIRKIGKYGRDNRDLFQQAQAYFILGYKNKHQRKSELAVKAYQNALFLFQKLKDKELERKVYLNLGNIYYDMGQYDLALQNYFNTERISASLPQQPGMETALFSIGKVYSDLKLYTKAEDYFQKAEVLLQKSDNTFLKQTLYIIRGQAKIQQDQLSAAETYLKKALSLTDTLADEDLYNLGFIYTALGLTYNRQNREKPAEYYLKKALAVRIKDADSLSILLANLALGEFYYARGNRDRAISIFLKTLAGSQRMSFLKGIAESARYLSQDYESLGNPRQALHYYKLYKESSDSLVNETTLKKINEQKEKFAIEQEVHKLKLQTALEKQKDRFLYYSIALVLCIIILLVLFFSARARKLEKQKHDLKLKEKELEEQLKITVATMNERKRIAADMHDDLGAGLSGLRLLAEIQAKGGRTDPQKEALKISTLSQELSGKLRDIIWTLDTEKDNLENLIFYIHKYASNLFENGDIRLHILIPDHIPQYKMNHIQRKHIFLSVKEVINNVIRHAQATEITIDFQIRNGTCLLTIQDNGTGIPGDKSRQGNGLQNIRKRMEAIQSRVEIKDQDGTRVRFYINLDFKNHPIG